MFKLKDSAFALKKKTLFPTKYWKVVKKNRLVYVFTISVTVLLIMDYFCDTNFFNLKNFLRNRHCTVSSTCCFKSQSFISTYNLSLSKGYLNKNLGEQEDPKYNDLTPTCNLNMLALGPIPANKTELNLTWVEKQYSEILAGGFYAPKNCQSKHRVAILISYRNREKNLIILLNHMHKFLMKQLLEYRIFVIEQCGNDKFNKGSLYNAGFIESQRFGKWHCIVFHDVDLLPLDQRILYSCPRQPTHLSPSVESQGYSLPYDELFGGVTVLTPAQFRAVNGYSNYYWNWGAEDDDMFIRLQAERFPVLHYSSTIGRYATLTHELNEINMEKDQILSSAKDRYKREGLNSLEYVIIKITKEKLYTHILVDINPYNYMSKKQFNIS